jgi:RND family efflux transporter MFP subunit
MVSGGFFKMGDVLLSIDPLDYEVALEQAKATLARAKSDLSNASKTHARQKSLEKKQSISESQMDDALNRLRIAQATLRESQAILARAERDLGRTQLTAPYDGRVRSETIDIGQFVSRGTALASLYATDIAEVRLPIHDEELAFLDLPLLVNGNTLERKIPVTLRARFAGAEHQWQAEVVRTEGELDPRTRMITVVAQVVQPYATHNNKPPLSVGLFVKAEIDGIDVDDVVIVPRSALRENSQVLIVDTENKLRFRTVEVLRIAQDSVYIQGGLNTGEKVCVSALNSPLDGMLVRLDSQRDTSLAVES